MRAGDLVRIKKQTPDMSIGIIFGVDHNFYGMTQLGNRMSRLHILWQDDTISTEPESFVEIVISGEWK